MGVYLDLNLMGWLCADLGFLSRPDSKQCTDDLSSFCLSKRFKIPRLGKQIVFKPLFFLFFKQFFLLLYLLNNKQILWLYRDYFLNRACRPSGKNLLCQRIQLITPPPKHTSPSYKTADCPGVTAHCGSGKVNAYAVSAKGSNAQAASAWR